MLGSAMGGCLDVLPNMAVTLRLCNAQSATQQWQLIDNTEAINIDMINRRHSFHNIYDDEPQPVADSNNNHLMSIMSVPVIVPSVLYNWNTSLLLR